MKISLSEVLMKFGERSLDKYHTLVESILRLVKYQFIDSMKTSNDSKFQSKSHFLN